MRQLTPIHCQAIHVRRLERQLFRVEEKHDRTLSNILSLSIKFDTFVNSPQAQGIPHVWHPQTIQTASEGPSHVPAASGHASDSRNIPHPMETLEAPTHNASSQREATSQLVCARLDDEDFYFDKTCLPDPPSIHYSQDIPALFREWHSSQLLTIDGRGIAIKHWEALYKKCKGFTDSNTWKVIGVEWLNWKVSTTLAHTGCISPVDTVLGRGAGALSVGRGILDGVQQ